MRGLFEKKEREKERKKTNEKKVFHRQNVSSKTSVLVEQDFAVNWEEEERKIAFWRVIIDWNKDKSFTSNKPMNL